MISLSFDRKDLFILFLGVISFFIFVPILTYFYFAKDLTTKDSIMNRNDTGLILLDRNKKTFFTFYQAKYRDIVPLTNIAITAQQAVIAGEDKGFYAHPGFSFSGIIRSVFKDVNSGGFAYGGSTITQQLVKISLLTSNKSIIRKYKEIVLAEEIERRFSKNQILEMYLNSVYFGKGAFGIEEAAQVYFGNHASQLSLTQSTYLASLLPAPSQLSMPEYKTQQRTRQHHILQVMQEENYITQKEEARAANEPLTFYAGKDTINTLAPHFALLVKDELVKRYGEEQISRLGLRVQTTIDSNWQQYAEQVVKEQVAKLAPDNVSNGAAVVMNPKTGEVEALVGSKDWNEEDFGKVNMATTPRQVGSSFKPIVYAAAMEKHLITPATVLRDVPTTFPGNYKPLDYDRKFRGNVLVRRALSNSLNIPSVEVMSRVGVAGALEEATRFGITTLGNDPSNYGLSLVLGTGEVPLTEMTRAYSVFADNGVKNDIITIKEIDDKKHSVLYKHQPHSQQILEGGVAYLLSSILSDNKARAEEFGNTLTISKTAAVKTGTTEDFKDALTLGYTPSLAVGVWVGNNNNKAMDRVAGSLGAAPIWKALMEKFTSSNEQFTMPSTVVKLSICPNGLVASGATTSAQLEYFLSGTQPTEYCSYQPRIADITPFPKIPVATSPQTTTLPSIPSGRSNDMPPGKLKKHLEN